ncbi:CBS domain-containing protein [Effusibacillus consociatus]|uniref:CBS domain-containing protein n=1 Tax=Effusibacillus consociatus TaxID=1117041 RepID=A0ABV9PYZ6_9BACL
MKLKELMTDNVHCCSPRDTVSEAAKMMRGINVGIIPVCEGEQLIGVITDRDIVLNVVAEGKDANRVLIENCMSSTVVTSHPEMDAHEAAELMSEHQVRRLPVVEKGQLVGIVSIGDLATVGIHENEAGRALSEISVPSRPH